jgi:hypothetical protein
MLEIILTFLAPRTTEAGSQGGIDLGWGVWDSEKEPDELASPSCVLCP